MVNSCSICHTVGNKGYFSLPAITQALRRRQWIDAIGLDADRVCKSTKVCYKHFAPSDIKHTKNMVSLTKGKNKTRQFCQKSLEAGSHDLNSQFTFLSVPFNSFSDSIPTIDIRCPLPPWISLGDDEGTISKETPSKVNQEDKSCQVDIGSLRDYEDEINELFEKVFTNA